MPERLKVDPIDLHMSSDHMDMHHAELQAAHAASDGVIDSAQIGWVGASASALSSKITEWQAATTRLCGEIAAHGAAYQAAATRYTAQDGDAAETINRSL